MNALGHSRDNSCELAYSRAVGGGIDEDPPRQSGFEPLEWLIISIGQRDGASGLGWTRFGEAVGRLFGVNGPRHLANPRLEQLRRMAASASGRGWQAPPSEKAAFIGAGWTDEQLELLVAAVAPAACARRAAAPLHREHTESARGHVRHFRDMRNPGGVTASAGHRG